MARKRYLKKTPLKEARELFLAGSIRAPLAAENLLWIRAPSRHFTPVSRASRRHTITPPRWTGSVSGRNTFGATEFAPKKLKRTSRDAGGRRLRLRGYRQLDSALGQRRLMIEKAISSTTATWRFSTLSDPGTTCGRRRDSVRDDELLLALSHRLRPYDLGARFGRRPYEGERQERPRVAILPTGDELIEPATSPSPAP